MQGFRAVSLFAALAVLCLGNPSPGRAQLPLPVSLSIEARPAFGVPTGGFSSASGLGATNGPGGSVGASVGLGPIAAYAEYTAVRFGCSQCSEAGLDDRALDTGWEVGAKLRLTPLPFLPVQPWVRGGVIGHQLQLSGDEGHVESKMGSGYSIGVGVDLPLLSYASVHLAPEVDYRSYSAEYDFQQFGSTSTDVRYLAVGLGLVYRF
ncbi:MAG TPA: hypothetical protein VFL93_04640 [Longimicrobiaceae bacterium]|nr:hypothetical protein [Longimicrobiaceae bacterium]